MPPCYAAAMSSEAWMMNREARKAARREARAASTLRAGGMHATDVTVLDLSTTGFRIATGVQLDVGQEISIGLAGVGARAARVAWARGTEYGCAFDLALEAEEAGHAFSGASVVPIGFVVRAAPSPIERGRLDDVYARHRSWAIPLDAIAATALFLGLFAAVFWMIVRP